MDLLKMLHIFLAQNQAEVWPRFWIVLNWIDSLDFSKLLYGFVNVSCPLSNKTRLKFDQEFKAGRSFCLGQKVLIESNAFGPLCLWKCFYIISVIPNYIFEESLTLTGTNFNCWFLLLYCAFIFFLTRGWKGNWQMTSSPHYIRSLSQPLKGEE